MNRRIFISAGLALVGLLQDAWAQLTDSSPAVRYATLARPVNIPVDSVAKPWQPVSFVAEWTRDDDRAVPKRVARRRVLISGVLFRTDTQLSALCITCPHEQCQVDLVTDRTRLVQMAGDKAVHPLFECGCHFSVFDAAREGARISGESPRGLYRFRVTGIHDGIVEIAEVEEAALAEV